MGPDRVTGQAPLPRMNFGIATVGDSFYVLGGIGDASNTFGIAFLML